MRDETAKTDFVVFTPGLQGGDELANYWMRQSTLRLRREISWIWHERGQGLPREPGELPPMIDRASDSLDLARHWDEKQIFFKNDVAANYLTDLIEEPPPEAQEYNRGSFGWVVRELELDNVSAFTLAIGLATAFDGSFGAVIGACLNDPARIYPSLQLVQRLWDRPEDVLILSDPMHPLFSFGLLCRVSHLQHQYPGTFWEQPLFVPSMIARMLTTQAKIKPAGLVEIHPDNEEEGKLSDANRIIAYRIKSENPSHLRIVPLLGKRRSAYRQMAVDISRYGHRTLWEYRGNPALLLQDDYQNMLVTLSWLKGHDIFIPYELFEGIERQRHRNDGLPLVSIPVTLYLVISEPRHISHIDHDLVLPVVAIPSLTYEQRLAAWKTGLGKQANKYTQIIKEMARRFRYEKETIHEICRELLNLPGTLTENVFIAACRAELSVEVGELASYVEPRFQNERLILPNKQSVQFKEQLAAMQALTMVHYSWGTAQAWNESGITVLFTGPPGTGKTMAAEVMASKLKLPMYRVDLSQVVNKYIGETEKNLKRIFDAADVSDMVLFFDEADSLFGKRIEANDARDRYANLEISYLLERMERFKGLAILATNRKKDLDQAFLRRIRYIIDFPVPDEAQRKEIWEQMVPTKVKETSHIDFAFLARKFPLSGGHIRSIVFNACLQSAYSGNGSKELLMKDVLVAVKREYDKLNRSLSLDHMGQYAEFVAGLD